MIKRRKGAKLQQETRFDTNRMANVGEMCDRERTATEKEIEESGERRKDMTKVHAVGG